MVISIIHKDGSIIIPNQIRDLPHIGEGDKIEWSILQNHGETVIQIKPIKDPYEYLKSKISDPELT
ncbi:MAG: hypothetical protein ACE5KT_02155 [Methanosarcinales archaeon]